MLNNVDLPQKEIDLNSLVFIERYVTSLLRFDLLSYFGNNPNYQQSAMEIANHLNSSLKSVRSELGDLSLLGLIQKSSATEPPTYQLTDHPQLRSDIIVFAQKHTQVKALD